MKTWIALFRGINVGGKNILPMAELRKDLESLKLENVRTYIQSGNVVFDAAAGSASSLTEKIRGQVEKRHGFRPQLLLLERKQLQAALKSNPFPEAVSDPSTLHLFFLAGKASSPDIEALDEIKTVTEKYKLTQRIFYLHAPDGIGRSKLASRAERHLGVVITARNYRTVEKLLSMVTG